MREMVSITVERLSVFFNAAQIVVSDKNREWIEYVNIVSSARINDLIDQFLHVVVLGHTHAKLADISVKE